MVNGAPNELSPRNLASNQNVDETQHSSTAFNPPTYTEILGDDTTAVSSIVVTPTDNIATDKEHQLGFVYKFETPYIDNSGALEHPLSTAGHSPVAETEQSSNSSRTRILNFFSFPNIRQFAIERNTIGTDCNFIIGFLAGFILHWIGLLVILCFGNTLSLRCGVISGFGFYIIKWVILMQTSRHARSKHDNDIFQTVLFLGVLAIGCFLFIYGLSSYLKAKRNQSINRSSQQV
ncbi:hypothetical protein GJ496_009245 [Pomphorhynchus laevis]|nr:hypothetical protein GJ496_009245 [Pomphorhynchus laevis]